MVFSNSSYGEARFGRLVFCVAFVVFVVAFFCLRSVFGVPNMLHVSLD